MSSHINRNILLGWVVAIVHFQAIVPILIRLDNILNVFIHYLVLLQIWVAWWALPRRYLLPCLRLLRHYYLFHLSISFWALCTFQIVFVTAGHIYNIITFVYIFEIFISTCLFLIVICFGVTIYFRFLKLIDFAWAICSDCNLFRILETAIIWKHINSWTLWKFSILCHIFSWAIVVNFIYIKSCSSTYQFHNFNFVLIFNNFSTCIDFIHSRPKWRAFPPLTCLTHCFIAYIASPFYYLRIILNLI